MSKRAKRVAGAAVLGAVYGAVLGGIMAFRAFGAHPDIPMLVGVGGGSAFVAGRLS